MHRDEPSSPENEPLGMAAVSLTEPENPPFPAPMRPHITVSRNIAAGHSPCDRNLENSSRTAAAQTGIKAF
ncbi:hypothetical protein H6A18_03630 [Collinsella tanakaei]|uniref:hypothetical protein n=1 Tax=Collinsella tanakaei TaxID=626935 RepID=UPI00195697C5|nr:hypothetical protein [Collinsella tanakaei]MBM6755616.1 hypothetical protein [Collinsella tanakaei]